MCTSSSSEFERKKRITEIRMGDLIDLNGPETKATLTNTKLASPLIPVPSTSSENSNILITGKRDSLDDNPFDIVFHKTTEYIRKKEDPFEIVLEKALKSRSAHKSTGIKSRSVDLTTDDWASLKSEISGTCKIGTETNGVNGQEKEPANLLVPDVNIVSHNLSILSQSAMNDTLSEYPINVEKLFVPNTRMKLPKIQRSFSQNEESFSTAGRSFHCFQRRLHSAVQNSPGKISDVLTTDTSDDPLNKAFLNSRCSESSVVSSLSNLSPVTKAHSVPSMTSISSVSSVSSVSRISSISSISSMSVLSGKNVMNKAFLTDHSALVLPSTIGAHSESSDPVQTLKEMKGISVNSQDMISADGDSKLVSVLCDTDKLNDKLVDVDVFVPKASFDETCRENSVSDTSSDSVFMNDTVNKAILCEAKTLAKTFEDLAHNGSRSGSSADDLLTGNSFWMSELLPAFEDENTVDDLIELHASNDSSGNECRNQCNDVKQGAASISNGEHHVNRDKSKDLSFIKDLEMELIDHNIVAAARKVTTTTLLLDLKRLVTTENNSEATRLLESLERVLGVEENKSNIDPMNTCFNVTADSTESSQKSVEKTETVAVDTEEEKITERVRDERFSSNIVNSHYIEAVEPFEEKRQESTKEGEKEVKKNETEKEKQLTINDRSEPDCVSESTERRDCLDERLAVELLIKLGKVLSGVNAYAETRLATGLLTKLGRVLNLALEDGASVPRSISKNDRFSINTQQKVTPTKPNAKYKNKRRSSTFTSKSSNELDAHAEFKTKPQRLSRRSVSVTNTPVSVTKVSSIATSVLRSTECSNRFQEAKKRFPSDPGRINSSLVGKEQCINEDGKTQIAGKTEFQAPRPMTLLDVRKERRSIKTDDVRSKLKKQIGGNTENRKGPLKAVHPLGNMQQEGEDGSFTRKTTTSVTPPTSTFNTVATSTPNSWNSASIAKRSPRSKPMASSTPDAKPKTRKIPSPVRSMHNIVLGKQSISCDVSPVSTHAGDDKENTKDSTGRIIRKLHTPPRSPLHKENQSVYSRYSASSGNKKNSAPEINLQVSLHSTEKTVQSYKVNKSPAFSGNKNGSRSQQSPLKDSNKIIPKVKPINLISKMRRYSGNDTKEKENYEQL